MFEISMGYQVKMSSERVRSKLTSSQARFGLEIYLEVLMILVG